MDEEIRLIDRPAFRAVLQFGLLVALYFGLGFFLPSENLLANQVWDAALCGAGLVFWTVFFSQFILPVRKLGDRMAILDRMMAYFTGFHGQAIFIENGVVRARQEEKGRHGPGVLWLDHASAAMLRTATRFTRPIGPGVHFTSRKEYIAATVDLHTMTQALGPNDDENPFTVSPSDENYQRILDSGLETRGMTRDGIEVIAPIAVTFRINAVEGQGGTPYGYNPENTRRFITESLIQGANTEQPVWNPLPAKMAVDIWREYLSRFRLNQLFEIPPGKDKTNFQLIVGLINQRMSQDVVEEVDDYGNFMGGTIPSVESQRLKEMGVKIQGVNVKRLIFPSDIDERLVDQWTTLWEKNAKKEKEQVEQIRRLREESAQIDAQVDFASIIADEFQNTLPSNKRHAAYLFTHGISQSVIRKPGLMNKIPKTDTSTLTELARWLKDKS